MKNLTLSVAAIVFLIFAISTSLSAQTTATWKGGKSGRTTDWNCAENWKEGRVPDEFAQVIIPARAACYPILKNTVQVIDALVVEGGATLTLRSNTTLTILGETGRFGGLTVLGIIRNDGVLEVGSDTEWNTAQLQQVQGPGRVINLISGIDTLVGGR